MQLRLPWRRSRQSAPGRALTAVVAAAATALATITIAPQPATAAAPACSSAGIGLTSLGGPNFYIDSGTTPSFTASYTGYTVANSTGAELDDTWVQLSNFTGGSLNLATGQAAAEQIPTLQASGTAPLFWYLNAAAASSTPQNYTVTVYRHNPALPNAVALCATSGGFASVQGTVDANPNKVTAITVSGGTPSLGSTFTVTVTGDTGTIGSGIDNDVQSFWMSPAVASTWPAGALRLVGTRLVISPDGTAPAQTYTNLLRLANLGSVSRSYTATYTFQAIGFTNSSTAVKPIEEIASGNLMKHTGALPTSIPPIAAPTNTLSLAVSAGPNRLNFGGGKVHYKATLSGTAGAAIDSYVVTPPVGATFATGSATIDGAPVADPVTSGGTLVFQGPFTLSAATSVLEFDLTLPGTPGNRSTAVVGTLGAAVIGATTADVSGKTPATATVNVDTAPTTTPASVTVPAGSSSDIDLSGFVADADADALTVTSANAGHGSVVTIGSGVRYTPVAGFTGSDTIGYSVSDGRGGTVAGSVAVTVAAGAPATQTIAFPRLTALTVGDSEPAAATASSGLPVSFRSATPDVCAVDSAGLVTARSTGTCTVAADQAGNDRYAAAPEVEQSISVFGHTQTVSLPELSGLAVGGTEIAAATASSGLPVSYRGGTPDVCSIDEDGNITALAAGTCTIAAGQDGNAEFAAAAEVSRSITVSRRPQEVSLGELTPLVAGDAENASATATSGLPITFDTVTPAVCTVDAAGLVTARAAGVCTVVADQPGDAEWAAAPSVTADVEVIAGPVDADPRPQTVTFPALADLAVHSFATAAATASSGLPVSFGSTTPEICTVDATGLVTALRAGTCTITADQPGDAAWLAAPEQARSLTVQLLEQLLTLDIPAALTVGDAESATANATSGLPITFGSTTPDVCSVDAAGLITALGAGTCTITAAQPGNSSYAPAPSATAQLTVERVSQSIDFPALSDLAVGDSEDVTAIASSGLAVTYRSTTPETCSITTAGADTRIGALAAGECTIAADQPGTATWAPAPTLTRTVHVLSAPVPLAPQRIDFPALANLTIGGAESSAATATSGLPVAYHSPTPMVCTADEDGTVTALAAGSCIVVAEQSGNGGWAAAEPRTRTLIVTRKPQRLTLDPMPGLTVGATTQAAATVSSGLPASFESATPEVCSVDAAGTVTGLLRGTCAVIADQPGNTEWAPAEKATTTLAVVGRSQQLRLTGPRRAVATDGTAFVSAVADSGLPTGYASTTPDVCGVSGTGQLTFAASGLCTVRASQPGDARWDAAADRSLTIIVSRATQHITFPAPTHLLVGADPYELAAASDANLPVSYVAEPAGVCAITGGQLIARAAGACHVTASAAGDQRYAAASAVAVDVALVEPAGKTVMLQATTTGAHSATVDVLAGTSGLRLTGVDQPSHGTAQVVKRGIRYRPTPSFRGTDPVTYRVADRVGRAATGRVLMIVSDAAPTAADVVTGQVAGTRSTVLVPAADVNGDRLTAIVRTTAPGVTATTHGRAVTITTASSMSGRLQLTVVISDGHGRSATAHIIDMVRPAPVPTATRSITSHGTNIRWDAAPGVGVHYLVQVDGQEVCRTGALGCRLARLLGPTAAVTVTVAGRDRTQSSARTAACASGRAVLVATLYFDTAKWTLRPNQTRRLASVGARLVTGGFSSVEVRGYTDAYGSASYNFHLSEQRTHTVARMLLARTGLHSQQSWYGKRHPVASSATARGAALNRRVCVYAR